MSECLHTADDVIRYHTDDMSDSERAVFATHLAACPSCTQALHAQGLLDRRVAALPEYRAPRLDEPRPRTVRQRVLIAATIAAVMAGGLLLERERREVEETRLVQAALAADARILAFIPGRTAPASGEVVLPPWLGFVMCDEWIASDPEGLYICALAPDGPLGRAGVAAGDVLLEIDRRPVRSDTAMHRRLARFAPGDVATVRIRHQDGRTERLRVRLEPRRVGERHPFDMDWSPALKESLNRTAPGAVDLSDVFIPEDTAPPAGLRVLLEPEPEEVQRTVLRPLPHLFGAGRLRRGDLIILVEDEPVARLFDLLPALARVQYRRSFDIHVLRDGEHVVLTIPNPRGTEP
jgi:hypothetical protein